MGLFKTLKEIIFHPEEEKVIAEIYANQKYWNIIVKLHNARIAQLGEEMMGTNTMTPEGQIKEHGLKERVNENEYYLSIFKAEHEKQEKLRKKNECKESKEGRFRKITSIKDL